MISHTAKVIKGKDVFIAPNATVIGNVQIGDNSSVWFGAILRGDNDLIKIGDRTNIQDGAIIHVDPNVPVSIGDEVIVGHAAIIHGATVGNNTLIGMRATLLNNSKIGNWCIIGAHALVTEGTIIPDFSVVMGSPAKVVKQLTEEQKIKVKKNAEVYVKLAKEYIM
ncbi:MAG: gamma carbonic anhydrase family protein [Bacteroidetes bacterium]|nr:gamma carbonic anhydrase family protein [Bacteroidota bacterium]